MTAIQVLSTDPIKLNKRIAATGMRITAVALVKIRLKETSVSN